MNFDFASKEYVEKVDMMIGDIELPKIVKVKQYFPDKKVADVYQETYDQLVKLNPDIKPGESIALTAGSRGIGGYLEMEKAAADYVKSRGANPFLVPAMGSHGGATAEGQANLIRGYGITEEAVGCPIASSMEVDQIGTTAEGLPVYIDRNAHQADGIILINRIKAHTTFEGKYESGLVKMLAIGLAKHKGALITHRLTFDNMGMNVEQIGKIGLHNLNIKCGIGSVENGYGDVADVFVMDKKTIEEKEPEILKYSKKMMASFAADKFDGLICQELGKDVSGAGMDTNLIGRYGGPKSGGPTIGKLGVLDVTEKSHGSTVGMGYADYTVKRLAEKLNFKDTYINAITTLNPKAVFLPLVLPNDKYLVQMIVKAAGKLDISKISLIFAKSTHEMEEVYMTEAAVKACNPEKKIEVVGDYFDIPFDKDGNLLLYTK